MLFIFDDSFSTQSQSFLESKDVALNNIANALREGKHLVIGSRAVLAKLIDCNFLSSKSTAIFRKALSQLSDIGTLASHLDIHIRIYPTIPSYNGPVFNDKIKCIDAPLDIFSDSSVIQETILLAENQIDAKFYELVARTYMWKKNFGKLIIKLTKQGGGGTTTADEYKEIQDTKNRLSICIVDSGVV